MAREVRETDGKGGEAIGRVRVIEIDLRSFILRLREGNRCCELVFGPKKRVGCEYVAAKMRNRAETAKYEEDRRFVLMVVALVAKLQEGLNKGSSSETNDRPFVSAGEIWNAGARELNQKKNRPFTNEATFCSSAGIYQIWRSRLCDPYDDGCPFSFRSDRDETALIDFAGGEQADLRSYLRTIFTQKTKTGVVHGKTPNKHVYGIGSGWTTKVTGEDVCDADVSRILRHCMEGRQAQKEKSKRDKSPCRKVVWRNLDWYKKVLIGDILSGALYVPQLHVDRGYGADFKHFLQQKEHILFPIIGKPGCGKTEELIALLLQNERLLFPVLICAEATASISDSLSRFLVSSGCPEKRSQAKVLREIVAEAKKCGKIPLLAIDGLDEYLRSTRPAQAVHDELVSIITDAAACGMKVVVGCRPVLWTQVYSNASPLKAEVFIAREIVEQESYDAHEPGEDGQIRLVRKTREKRILVPGIRIDRMEDSFISAYRRNLSRYGKRSNEIVLPAEVDSPFHLRLLVYLSLKGVAYPGEPADVRQCLRLYLDVILEEAKSNFGSSVGTGFKALSASLFCLTGASPTIRRFIPFEEAAEILGGGHVVRWMASRHVFRTDVWLEESRPAVTFYDNKLLEAAYSVGLTECLMRCPNEEARYGQLVTLVDGSLLPEMEQRWNVLHLTAWALKDGLHCNVADVIDAGCCLIQGYVFDRPIYSKICEGVAGNPSGTVTKLLERLLAVEGAQEFAARAIASQAPIEELTRILDVVAHEVKAAVVAWLPTTCKTRQDAGVLLKGRLCTDHHRCGYGLLYCAGHYGLADVLKAMKASAVMRSDGYEGEHLRKMFQWARRMCNDKEYRRKNCGSI